MSSGKTVTTPNSRSNQQLLSELTRLRKDLWLSSPIEPLFSWSTIQLSPDLDLARIEPIDTLTGHSIIRMPFAAPTSDYGHIYLLKTTGETLDLGATGAGGVIDGTSSPSATHSALAWGFRDPVTREFLHFGLTRKSPIAYSAISSGAKGASATITVAGTGNNRGWRIPTGARVIVREGTTAGDDWNQGVVTARTNTSITITLDNESYGTVIAAATGEVLQLDTFRPQLATEDSLYPGGGEQYDYCYMGSLEVTPNNTILQLRKRGDILYFGANITIYSATITANGTADVSLGQWLDFRSTHVEMRTTNENTVTTGSVQIHVSSWDGTTNFVRMSGPISHTAFAGNNDTEVADDETLFNPHTGVVRIAAEVAGAGNSAAVTVILRGYREVNY